MTTKLAVSLPDDLAEHARRMVRSGQAATVSGAVAAALERHRDQESAQAFLAELMEASGGPATADELASAAREIDPR